MRSGEPTMTGLGPQEHGYPSPARGVSPTCGLPRRSVIATVTALTLVALVVSGCSASESPKSLNASIQPIAGPRSTKAPIDDRSSSGSTSATREEPARTGDSSTDAPSASDAGEMIPNTTDPSRGPFQDKARRGVSRADAERVGTPLTNPDTLSTPMLVTDHADATTQAPVILSELLRRYDRAAAMLASDPTAALDPLGASRQAWHSVVPADSVLHEGVFESLVLEPLADGTRVVASIDGVFYRHRVTKWKVSDDASIEFSFCEYAPARRVDSTTGETLDDSVGRFIGVGRALVLPGTAGDAWMLDDLASLDSLTLPKGSPDPCA